MVGVRGHWLVASAVAWWPRCLAHGPGCCQRHPLFHSEHGCLDDKHRPTMSTYRWPRRCDQTGEEPLQYQTHHGGTPTHTLGIDQLPIEPKTLQHTCGTHLGSDACCCRSSLDCFGNIFIFGSLADRFEVFRTISAIHDRNFFSNLTATTHARWRLHLLVQTLFLLRASHGSHLQQNSGY